jgi:hypothetical protein
LRIHCCSSPCGSGKTYQLLNLACELAKHHKKVLLIQPTKELIDRTVKEELLARSDPPDYRVIHGGTVPSDTSVALELANHLKSSDDGGEVVFVTQSVLPYVPFWTNKRDWHVLVDEELPVIRCQTHRMPQTHNLITDDLEIKNFNVGYGQVRVTNQNSLKQKARNPDDDDVLGTLADTLRILTNSNWDSFVDAAQYAKLLKGTGRDLTFHSIMKPDIFKGFASVLMVGAGFEETAICRLWSGAGVTFQNDEAFSNKLRHRTHPNGELVTIYYLTEDDWSRKRRDTKVPDQGTVFDLAVTAVKTLFAADRFVWQANKSITADLFGVNASRLPNKAHGLNSYANFHKIAFLSSLNYNPDHCKFLRSRGFSDHEIRALNYFPTVYQSAMRTSIRNPDDSQPKTIVVVDLGAAQYLHDALPGSQVKFFDAGIPKLSGNKGGRPKKYPTNAARLAEQRKRAADKKLRVLRDLFDLKDSQDDSKSRCNPENSGDRGALTGIELSTSIGSAPCYGSLFQFDDCGTANGFLSCDNIDRFVHFLRLCHGKSVPKESNWLISPALFDPGKAVGTRRGDANIVSLQTLWLDFENGDLPPAEFAALFPQYRMVITNSSNHTASRPRYRVIIPMTQSVTADGYTLLYANIVQRLKDAGYTVGIKKNSSAPRSGMDTGKRPPCSLFKLPSQAQIPGDSFFHDHNETGRTLLDPMLWVENSIVPIQPEYDEEPVVDIPLGPIDMVAVFHATREWRSTPPDHGGEGFWRLSLTLFRLGMTLDEIKDMLEIEAEHGRHPIQRKAQIKSIMVSLKRKKRSTESA